jgi:hypothetical protein
MEARDGEITRADGASGNYIVWHQLRL